MKNTDNAKLFTIEIKLPAFFFSQHTRIPKQTLLAFCFCKCYLKSRIVKHLLNTCLKLWICHILHQSQPGALTSNKTQTNQTNQAYWCFWQGLTCTVEKNTAITCPWLLVRDLRTSSDRIFVVPSHIDSTWWQKRPCKSKKEPFGATAVNKGEHEPMKIWGSVKGLSRKSPKISCLTTSGKKLCWWERGAQLHYWTRKQSPAPGTDHVPSLVMMGLRKAARKNCNTCSESGEECVFLWACL